jgi:hypothetical protein
MDGGLTAWAGAARTAMLALTASSSTKLKAF